MVTSGSSHGLLSGYAPAEIHLYPCPKCRSHVYGLAAYCKPENKVSLGFVEGLNNKIRVMQRRAYGLRDEEYLKLKVLTSMLPQL
jgi:hypothetical protein